MASSSNIYFTTGSVGIGSSAPGYTLDVKGSVHISGAFYAPGSVVQVVVASVIPSALITETTETLLVNPLITITPRYANSMITFQVCFGGYPSSIDFYSSLYIRRNTLGTAISSCTTSWGEWSYNFFSIGSGGAHMFNNFIAYDYPGTTTVNYLLTGLNYQTGKRYTLWDGHSIRVIAQEIAQ